MCSNNAAFVITLAAVCHFPRFYPLCMKIHDRLIRLKQEMFIQHLAEESQTEAKLERKPRRNIQYKDVGEKPSKPQHTHVLLGVLQNNKIQQLTGVSTPSKCNLTPRPPRIPRRRRPQNSPLQESQSLSIHRPGPYPRRQDRREQ